MTIRSRPRRALRTALTAAAATALLASTATVAGAATGGEISGSGSQYFLTNGWSGTTASDFVYGRANDAIYVGDWDGDGVDTLAVRRGAAYHFKNSLSGGDADRVVVYGRAGDTVLMGDWDGDGVDTPVVRRGAAYHFKNSLTPGNADRVIVYGRPGDTVMVGDWNGDGKDTLGVRRGATYHLKNSISGGKADHVVTYGRPGDEVLVGDWDADGKDTLGIRRGNEYHLKNVIAGGKADRVMPYGRATDGVMVGDWDGDGTDTIGVRRTYTAPKKPSGIQVLDEYDAHMVELINAERAKAGVAPLTPVPAFRAGPLKHSEWMARTGHFEHATREQIDSDGAAVGCSYIGENIYMSTWPGSEPVQAMNAYMSSPGHRRNILSPDYRFVAVGTVLIKSNGGQATYNTQRFAYQC